MHKEVTGVMVYYYHVCTRKLWYFYHDIHMEHENDDVRIGKFIDETSYSRDEKHININDVINIDFVRESGVIHEVKKSNKIEEATIWQARYYLYYLKKHGVDVTAQIDYPLLKKTLEVSLDDKDMEYLDSIIESIYQIVDQKYIPLSEKKSICKKCAYFDLCYI